MAAYSPRSALDSRPSTSHSIGYPKLNLGHKLFLSHSGADKDFVKELDQYLREHLYNPFYDAKSLPKAEIVSMINILEEAKDCELALFVLSDDFFQRNRNPMLELVACVDAEVRLLPLFYKINPDQIKGKSKMKEDWYRKWKEWEDEDSKKLDDPRKVDLAKWKFALEVLGATNGLIMGEDTVADYIRKIIEHVHDLVAPDVRMDDSGIQGKQRLREVLDDLFVQAAQLVVERPTVPIVALYGMGGTGKTTLCKSLLQHYHGRFKGRVFLVRLDKESSEESELGRLREALKYLTRASQEDVMQRRDVDEGWAMWKDRVGKNEIFLALDNVCSEKSFQEARKYLGADFQEGSKILITARSPDFLQHLSVPRPSKLAPMPDLNLEEAKMIFLERARRGINVDQQVIIRCVESCSFRKPKDGSPEYHPLALQALGAWLESMSHVDPCNWVTYLNHSHFRESSAKEEIVFQVLEESYKALSRGDQQLFLDIALFIPGHLKNQLEDVCKWLKSIHDKEISTIEHRLRELSRKAIINVSREGVMVHDLYAELAQKIIEKGHECVYEERCKVRICKSFESCSRIAIRHCEFLGPPILPVSPQVEVLKIDSCTGLDEISLQNATSLGSIEIASSFISRITGLQNGLQNATSSRLSCFHIEAPWLDEEREQGGTSTSSLESYVFPSRFFVEMAFLEVVHIVGSAFEGRLSFAGCRLLREVHLEECSSLQEWVDTEEPLGRLQKLIIEGCRSLRRLLLTGCKALTELQVSVSDGMFSVLMRLQEEEEDPEEGEREEHKATALQNETGKRNRKTKRMSWGKEEEENETGEEEAFWQLTGLVNVEKLDFQMSAVSRLEAVGKFQKLQKLIVFGSRSDWPPVTGGPEVSQLRLENSELVNLQTLELQCIRICSGSFTFSRMTSLLSLRFSWVDGGVDLSDLSSCTNLQTLQLRYINLSCSSDVSCSRMTNLQSLCFHRVVGVGVGDLSSCTALEHVQLDWRNFTGQISSVPNLDIVGSLMENAAAYPSETLNFLAASEDGKKVLSSVAGLADGDLFLTLFHQLLFLDKDDSKLREVFCGEELMLAVLRKLKLSAPEWESAMGDVKSFIFQLQNLEPQKQSQPSPAGGESGLENFASLGIVAYVARVDESLIAAQPCVSLVLQAILLVCGKAASLCSRESYWRMLSFGTTIAIRAALQLLKNKYVMKEVEEQGGRARAEWLDGEKLGALL